MSRRTNSPDQPGQSDAQRIVFRPTSGIVFTLIAWAICAAVIVSSLVSGHGGLRPLVLALTGGWVIWLLLWRPSVVCYDDRAEFRNLFRDVTIPYALIDDVDTRFTLAVEAGGIRYSAWGAPAPGKVRAMNIRRGENPGQDLPHALREQGRVRPGDLTSTASGAPATVIRRALDERARAGVKGPSGAVTVAWRPVLIGVTALLVGASIVTIALGA